MEHDDQKEDLKRFLISEDVLLPFKEEIRFTDFDLHNDLLEALLNNGYYHPSPVQYQVLIPGINGESLLVQAKSGTGKTLAFSLIMINRILNKLENSAPKKDLCELLSISIAPTREICIQINQVVNSMISPHRQNTEDNSKYKIRAICCIGGTGILEDLKKFSEYGSVILTSSPGRLLQLIADKNLICMKPEIFEKSLLCLTLDEADRLFEDCFYNQTREILKNCLVSCNVQFLGFSATFPPDTFQCLLSALNEADNSTSRVDGLNNRRQIKQIQLCSSFGYNSHCLEDGEKSSCNAVYYKIVEFGNETEDISETFLSISKKLDSPILKGLKFYIYDLYMSMIFDIDINEDNDYQIWSYQINSILDVLLKVPYRQAFVFANDNSLGYRIAGSLKNYGIPASYTSGRRSQTEREEILFALKSNDCRVVVCSDLFSRGIDISSIDLVINTDIPIDKETFIHRTGRAARYGQSGTIVCILSHRHDFEMLQYITNQLGISLISFKEYKTEELLVFNNEQLKVNTKGYYSEDLSEDLQTSILYNCTQQGDGETELSNVTSSKSSIKELDKHEVSNNCCIHKVNEDISQIYTEICANCYNLENIVASEADHLKIISKIKSENLLGKKALLFVWELHKMIWCS
ncbi:DEAD/DEAH box helicase family protein [Cryptosporidium serpentis]